MTLKTGITKAHCQCTARCRGRNELSGSWVRTCDEACSHDDRYRVRKRMPNGKQVERWFGTYGEAEVALFELESEKRAPRAEAIFEEVGSFVTVADRWLADLDASDREAKTKAEYRRIVERVLVPVFGHRPVRTISQREVQDLVNEWATGGLAAQTVRNRINVLVPILHEGGNPVSVGRSRRGVNLPSRSRGLGLGEGEVVRRRLYLQTAEELAQLVGAMPDEYRLLVLFAGFAGTRPGETLELRASDIVNEMRVEVSRSAKDLSGGRKHRGNYRVGDTKTHKHRPVAVRAEILEAIKAAVVERVGVSEWAEVDPDALLFASREDGFDRHMDYDNLQQAWRKAVVASLPERLAKLRLYDLRHTAASILINQGAPALVVSTQLGHSTTKTTEIYSHLFESTVDSLLDRLGDKVGVVMRAVA